MSILRLRIDQNILFVEVKVMQHLGIILIVALVAIGLSFLLFRRRQQNNQPALWYDPQPAYAAVPTAVPTVDTDPISLSQTMTTPRRNITPQQRRAARHRQRKHMLRFHGGPLGHRTH